LPSCELVVGTEEEFRVAGGSSDVIPALRAVRERTAALLVVKLGPRGCVAFPGAIPARLEEGVLAKGFPVEVFNVLGAGDAFMAGFLRGWLRGEPLARCCEYANACGAIVVSRHGCAPAMATAAELQQFLARPPANPRLREDRELAHVHRATTRRPLRTPLHILAFDHRSHFEALADAHGAPRSRVGEFKALVAEAFVRVAKDHPGSGVIVDDRYGEALLPRLTAHGYWVARPVEEPNAIPLAFESGENLGLALRTWPAEHVAKCLVYFHPDDPAELQRLQGGRLAALAEACAATGRELLLEVVPPPHFTAGVDTVARAIDAIYRAGVRPDWWKLPPNGAPEAWRAVDAAIDRHDPLCRGVLVLGMEASAAKLREGFAAAAGSPWVRGFAVGRSIFAAAAEQWFAGAWRDERAVDDIAARYAEVIALWREASRKQKETA
jgi:5-dehydro-2-deoxygluconokinase